MSKINLVTGAAGFIGSHLCEALIDSGHTVRGVDSFHDNYDHRLKRDNLRDIMQSPAFEFIEGSLNDVDLDGLLGGVSCVFHLAAQPGVRQSWQAQFDDYIDANIRATQKLCDASRKVPLKRFVYASSSSVYGETVDLPMCEAHVTRPHSPYGVTKLAGEALCLLYKKNFGLPVVALRFFTVFGPRQRPDMAFHIFLSRAFDGLPIEIFGNGTQTRDFTYVSDIVDANIAAMNYGGDEDVFNIGGGTRTSLNSALDIIADIAPVGTEVKYGDRVKGDVTHTYADIGLAERELGYSPKVALEDGLRMQAEWLQAVRTRLSAREDPR